MKKILLLITLLICSVFSYSQSKVNFMGIPVEGSLKSVSNKIENKGFNKASKGGRFLTGNFGGKPATIYIASPNNMDIVYAIMVTFDPHISWKGLHTEYLLFIKMFTQKYGECSSTSSSFESDYDYEGRELSLVRDGKSLFISMWDLSDGFISVSITKNCEVELVYYNNMQYEVIKNTLQKEILNDI